MTTQGINASRRRRGGSRELAAVRETPIDRVPRTTVDVDGRTFELGKVSLNQLTAMAHTVIAAARKMPPEQLKALKEAAGGPQADIEAALSVLQPDTVAAVFGAVLDADADWVKEHVGAVDALNIVDALLEHNDWKELQGAFLRLTRRFASSTPPS
jgi:hypothetical protein